MKRYTFIAEYRGGTYISQYVAQTLKDALYMWAEKLDTEIFSTSKRNRILLEVNDPDQIPIPLKGLEKVWCSCYLSGESFLLLNIIETT